jgi:putative ATPase
LDLFEQHAAQKGKATRPLADRMRPSCLDEFVGQEALVGPNGVIRRAVEADRLFSMVLWGPPGCGKTTLARIIARETRSHFAQFSAVLSGVKEIRAVIEAAKTHLSMGGRKTILFVDEIHRFNKAQQDAFLHQVESGLLTLIGATTENPSFEVNPALMSRCRVITLTPLTEEELLLIVRSALKDSERGLGALGIEMTSEALAHLVRISDGDARVALSGLEIVASLPRLHQKSASHASTAPITLAEIANALQKRAPIYDKSGEGHFNLISALHKSLRGGDPDAALYWLARMLAAGEDPLYIARRMVRFASEDVGCADPHALGITLTAMESYRFLGSPEGELALAQAAIYLACAPKSNRVYDAYGKVREIVAKTGSLPVPLHIRNAPTRLMKDLGYAKGYRYAHDYPEAYTPQKYLPSQLAGRIFYSPSNRGYERAIAQRLAHWRALKDDALKHEDRNPDGAEKSP